MILTLKVLFLLQKMLLNNLLVVHAHVDTAVIADHDHKDATAPVLEVLPDDGHNPTIS